MTHITVVGSSNTDMIIRLPQLPRPGETLLGGSFSTAGGGKGANQAMAAARLGAPTRLLACVGEDSFGAQALAALADAGVDVSHCIRDAHTPSGIAQILVAENGENCIAVAPGANAQLRPAHVRAAQGALFEQASLLMLQLETPLETVVAAAAAARAAGVRVLLNPAPAQELPEELCRQVDILTPNESEAGLLTGTAVNDTASAAEAAARLHALGIGTVLITRGSAGVYLSTCGLSTCGRSTHELSSQEPGAPVQGVEFSAFSVPAVDTTGAGDVFNAAFAVALLEGRSPHEAVPFAQAAAALSVQRAGAQSSIPTRAEVEHFLRTLDGGG